MWDDPSREGKVEELPLVIDKAGDKEFKDQEVLDQEFSEDFFLTNFANERRQNKAAKLE